VATLFLRYGPMLLEDFHIRAGSGGRGKWNAGDEVRRTVRFLERMECTILSGHHRVRPFGLADGEPSEIGEIGENWVRRIDGRMERLQGRRRHDARCRRRDHYSDPDSGGYGKA
jgi:5-oxoprolinase (ATP-hydrolysing)